MTREEVKRILMIIQETFPNWEIKDKRGTLDVWAMVFRDDDYQAIEAGLMTYIRNDTSGFAPSPGQIRTNVKDLVEDYDDTEDAIAELRNALKNGSYGYLQEFERLSPALQKVVGRAENLRAWAAMETDELETVVFSHVRRSYRNHKAQEKTIRKLDPVTNDLIEDAERRARWLKTRAAAGPAIAQKPNGMQIEEKPETEERRPYERKLLPEERDAIIETWNSRKMEIRFAMPLTELLISPARDTKLRELIDRIGMTETMKKITASEAKTLGEFLREVKA